MSQKRRKLEGRKTGKKRDKMPVRKYVVTLSKAERDGLYELIQNEAPRSRRVKHAKILLESDRARARIG
jgi:hypothetical protein